jgi:hypothetical protein
VKTLKKQSITKLMGEMCFRGHTSFYNRLFFRENNWIKKSLSNFAIWIDVDKEMLHLMIPFCLELS